MPEEEQQQYNISQELKKILLRPILRFEPKPAVLRIAKTGQKVKGQGIFIGLYSPTDSEGNSLGKIFNAFAAPQDLPGKMTYLEVLKHIARLEHWNGFNGTKYATDQEIFSALKDGTYDGGWIVPPHDLLAGTKPDTGPGRKGRVIMTDNLFHYRNKGALKGTFKISTSPLDNSGFYLASTRSSRTEPSLMTAVRFSDGYEVATINNISSMSCRPVRLVPVKQ